MKGVKPIKIFKKKSWKKEWQSLIIGLPVYFVLSRSLGLEYLIMFLVVYMIASAFINLNFRSILEIYDQYMVCNNPFIFWKHKKLLYYHKIDKIVINKQLSDLHPFKIYYKDGSIFKYAVEADQVEAFNQILKLKGIEVIRKENNLLK